MILLKLSDKSLTQLLATCKYFHEFYKYDKLWNMKIVNQYGDEFLDKTGFQNYCQIKKFFSQARKYEVPADIYFNEQVSGYQWKFDEIVEAEPTRIALQYFNQGEIKLRRGDIIWFSFMGQYNNWGITIFDGQTLKPLDDEYDDVNGSVPQEFYVLTPNKGNIFPLTYWTTEISTHVWLKVNDLGPTKIEVQNRYVFASFTVEDVCYSIITTDLSDFSCYPDQETIDLAKEKLAQDLNSEFLCVDQYHPDFEDNDGLEISKFVPGIRLYF